MVKSIDEDAADSSFDYSPRCPVSDYDGHTHNEEGGDGAGVRVKYLMSWKDLDESHLAELKHLKADTLDYLSEVFGVDANTLQEYDLQFHTTNAVRNPLFIADRGHFMTLHLQVGVRYFWTVSCLNRFVSLDHCIRVLESPGGALQQPAHHEYFDETNLSRDDIARMTRTGQVELSNTPYA